MSWSRRKILPEQEEPHFWSRVDRTGDCWIFSGSRSRFGHGRMLFRGTYTFAHRVAWRLTFGEIPRGMNVCHRCDNPPCVRPDHLFLGTQADNLRDMKRKGRSIRKTVCKRGHPLVEGNVYFDKRGNRKGCRLCARVIAAARYRAFIDEGGMPSEWRRRKAAA